MLGSSSSSSSSAIESSISQGTPDIALVALYSRFHLICRDPLCRSALSVHKLKEHFDDWLTSAKQIPPASPLSVVCCSKCRNSTCVGCGKNPNSTDMTFTPFGVVDRCCHQGLLFSIWAILSRWDIKDVKTFEEFAKKIEVPDKYSGFCKHMAKSSGTGYAVNTTADPALSYDDMFGDYEPEDLEELSDMIDLATQYRVELTAGPSKTDSEEESDTDLLLEQVLTLLVAFLKPGTSEQVSDTFIEDVLLLLRSSTLWDTVTELVRNDSIAEMTNRHGVYNALFEFLKAIIKHPKLCVAITEPRSKRRNTPSLHVLSDGVNVIEDHLADQIISASLFECSKNTYRQAKTYLNLAFKSGQDSPKKASIRLCNTFVELYNCMQNLPNTMAPVSLVELGDPWVHYAGENRVTFSDDVLSIHSYLSGNGNKPSDSQRGRLSTISKEIANMTTSLPVGIFLRVAESRSDMMKALIVGPEGSPYAGGLFPEYLKFPYLRTFLYQFHALANGHSFDIFLDANYPLTPPKVKFVLPGNETSMNPNLHPGGNVCLSLINTWAGAPSERWQPNKSTVLSVLVSIQAMILGATLPWLNEPGFENQENEPKALSYNLELQCKTVKFAMLSWLKYPIASDQVWAEISGMYWKCNGWQVLRWVQEWRTKNKLLARFNQNALQSSPHHVMHPHHFGNKKAKRNAEVDPTEDLVEQLTKALGFEVPDISREQAASDSSAKAVNGKRRAPETGDSGTKRLRSSKITVNAIAGGMVWKYMGGDDMKSIRSAFQEIGSTPARSITESIERIEQFVMDKGLWETTSAKKWGEMQVCGGAHESKSNENTS